MKKKIIIILTMILPAVFYGLGTLVINASSGDDKINIAIVNEDLGTVHGEDSFNYGSQFSQDVVNNDQFDWNIVVRQTALEGVKEGTYDLVVFIPANFSESVLNLNEASPTKAYLDVKVGENITGERYEKVVNELNSFQLLINDSMSVVYFTSILGELYTSQKTLDDVILNEEEILEYMTSLKDEELMNAINAMVSTSTYIDFYKQNVDSMSTTLESVTNKNENGYQNWSESKKEVEEVKNLIDVYTNSTVENSVAISSHNVQQEKLFQEMLVFMVVNYNSQLDFLNTSYNFSLYLENSNIANVIGSNNILTNDIILQQNINVESLRKSIIDEFNLTVDNLGGVKSASDVQGCINRPTTTEDDSCRYVLLNQSYVDRINNTYAFINLVGGTNVKSIFTGEVVVDRNFYGSSVTSNIMLDNNFKNKYDQFFVDLDNIITKYYGNVSFDNSYLNVYKSINSNSSSNDILLLASDKESYVYINYAWLSETMHNNGFNMLDTTLFNSNYDFILNIQSNTKLNTINVDDLNNNIEFHRSAVVSNACDLEKYFDSDTDYNQLSITSNVVNYTTSNNENIINENRDTSVFNLETEFASSNCNAGFVNVFIDGNTNLIDNWKNEETGIETTMLGLSNEMVGLNEDNKKTIDNNFTIVIENNTNTTDGLIIINNNIINLNDRTEELGEELNSTSENAISAVQEYDNSVVAIEEGIDENISFNEYYQSILSNSKVNGSPSQDFTQFLTSPVGLTKVEKSIAINLFDTYIYLVVLMLSSLVNYFILNKVISNKSSSIFKDTSSVRYIGSILGIVMVESVLLVSLMYYINGYSIIQFVVWLIQTFLILSVLELTYIIIGNKSEIFLKFIIMLLLSVTIFQVFVISKYQPESFLLGLNYNIVNDIDRISNGYYNLSLVISTLALVVLGIEILYYSKREI